MTETLNRPTSPSPEQLEQYDKQLAILRNLQSQPESPADSDASPTLVESSPAESTESAPEVSPLAVRVRNAAERFATRLEKRAINRAHDAALEQYRKDDPSGYVDHVAGLAANGATEEARVLNAGLLRKEENRSDREALIDAGKDRIKDMGYIAVGLGAMGYNIAEKQANRATRAARHKLQDKSFAREDAKLHRQYNRDVKKLNKQTAKQNAKLDKLDAKDMRRAKKYDEKFERSMARKQKWENRSEAVISTLEKGAYAAGKTYASTVEAYERTRSTTQEAKRKMGKLVIKARSTGTAVLEASKEAKK